MKDFPRSAIFDLILILILIASASVNIIAAGGDPDLELNPGFTAFPIADNIALRTAELPHAAPFATFMVLNTNDSGPDSLRAAIEGANAAPGADTISFAIPGGGVKTIAPVADLPAITGPVTIDGYTQPGSSPNTLAVGNNAVILIELEGQVTHSALPFPTAPRQFAAWSSIALTAPSNSSPVARAGV